MQEYSNEEIDFLALQIGCIVRVERLRQKVSQESLGLSIGSNKTTIGRLERYEHSTSWKILFKVCQLLKIEYNSMFVLQSLDFVLSIINESLNLEDKLTAEKQLFYKNLEIDAKTKFSNIQK
ncbi:helix-turn-helix transcriptional regulator [Chryseobacterium indologenes]|uniref:helix-turn-helix transcriptional regulator n=2 Tax=Chryseobacterium indologenes TaxID=253 RepID=UPI00162587BB|nr:helix-turn-helix transcriptional regulator [Chryseobacterium indologenes]MBF6643918.1 helix-turn-helix transcriptional regulator [Chryseobacterium indologenes]QQQ72354.1 helix-turn-helix transcriptional regulator [Chryseobacterium indologenes]